MAVWVPKKCYFYRSFVELGPVADEVSFHSVEIVFCLYLGLFDLILGLVDGLIEPGPEEVVEVELFYCLGLELL